MVFVFVPPQKRGRKPSPRENATGIFIAAMIGLGFAVFIAFMGPEFRSPPPPIVKWALVGLAVVFVLISFFSWLRHQGDGDNHEEDQHSQEEQ